MPIHTHTVARARTNTHIDELLFSPNAIKKKKSTFDEFSSHSLNDHINNKLITFLQNYGISQLTYATLPRKCWRINFPLPLIWQRTIFFFFFTWFGFASREDLLRNRKQTHNWILILLVRSFRCTASEWRAQHTSSFPLTTCRRIDCTYSLSTVWKSECYVCLFSCLRGV